MVQKKEKTKKYNKYAEEKKEIEHAKSLLKKVNAFKNDDSEALFIPAGVLTGMGFGFLYGNLVAGLFIGLGIGFIIFAIFATIKSLKK